MHKMLGIIAILSIISRMKTHENFNEISKEELLKIVAQQAKQIQFLEEQILAYQLRQFAAKSEKMNPNQASLFDEAELPKSEEKILSQEEEITVASYKRQNKAGRKPLPAELLRVPRVYDLSEEEKTCFCGCDLIHIKDEKANSWKLFLQKFM